MARGQSHDRCPGLKQPDADTLGDDGFTIRMKNLKCKASAAAENIGLRTYDPCFNSSRIHGSIQAAANL
eukprot:15537372-Heterocapsa_arctica.AAC.1